MRLGPYGNGDCSSSYNGELLLSGETTTRSVACWCNPRLPAGIPRTHGGAANMAARDGLLATLGNGELLLLDAKTLETVRSYPTVVRTGAPGWDFVKSFKRDGSMRGLSGHSVPAGLSTIYWLRDGEDDIVSIRPGGDVGSRIEGHDLIAVRGSPVVPTLRRESNQREWLAAADGTGFGRVLVAMGGHAFGRTAIDSFAGVVRVPNMINNPGYMSTRDCHYMIVPGEIRHPRGDKGFLEHAPGLSVWRVDANSSVSSVFLDKAMSVWTGWDGTYAPSSHCLAGGFIYAATKSNELSAINTETWTATKTRMPAMGYRPRVAANAAGDVVVCGLGTLCVPGRWSVPVQLDSEATQTNKQGTNRLVITNTTVYLCRILLGNLSVEARRLKDGSISGRYEVPVPGADLTGQCLDAFAYDGSLYCLCNAKEPLRGPDSKFHQFVVRIS